VGTAQRAPLPTLRSDLTPTMKKTWSTLRPSRRSPHSAFATTPQNTGSGP